MIILTEFAYQKRLLLDKFYQLSDEFVDHMMCLYFLPDNPSFNHWKGEVVTFYQSCGKLKSTKKFPTYKELYHVIWGGQEDIFYEHFDGLINNLEFKEDVNINYNEEDILNCHQFISDYVDWICKSLSTVGLVDRKSAYIKLDDLLKLYR